MRVPSWARDWRTYAAVGGGGVALTLGWLVLRKERLSHLPIGPAAWRDPEPLPGPSDPSLPAPLYWFELSGSPVRLVFGTRYRGCVRVSAWNPLRGLATLDRVRDGVISAGFVDVQVYGGDPPAGWSPDVECYRYVEATWGQADRDYDRPDKLAVAWRLGTG
jgi:hypothetical protein